FGLLRNLTILAVYENNFFGDIPYEIGNLKSLVELDLSENQLNGSIPGSLGDLTSLTYFNLYSNKLSSTIPNDIGNLKSLVDLELSSNTLSELDLSSNRLFGLIPKEFGRLTSLVKLINMQSLVTLNLSHGNLSSSIPSSLEEIRHLSYIDISYNHLEGSLPNITAFREAPPEALKGNKGLCGKVGALPPCNEHGSKEHRKRVFGI
ncbi:unnamed protein product, partial [Prunus brigantina]